MEMRLTNRHELTKEVVFHFPLQVRGRMIDYSAGGILAEMNKPLTPDTAVSVMVFGSLLARGHVRWANFQDGVHRVGIKFDKADSHVIQFVLDQKLILN